MSDNDDMQRINRSPHYPYLSLDQAVNLLEIFYKKYKLNKVPISLALKEIGYSATSGAGKRVTASLTQHYGLIDVEGSGEQRRFSVSSLGKTILVPNPSNPSERAKAIQEAALRPEMHSWIFNRYDLATNGLPPDDQLIYDLVYVAGFVDTSVESFVKEFKATYYYAGLDSLKTEDASIELDDGGQASTYESKNPPPRNAPAVQTVPSNSQELTTSLTRGKIARLILPDEMNSMDFNLLVKWLELLREAAMYEEQSGSN